MRRLVLAAVLLAQACGDTSTSGFSTGPVVMSVAQETGPGSTDSSSSGPSGDTSTSTSGSSEGGSASGSTTLVLDVGSADVGVLQPEGCKGKIDFLFVISRHNFMHAFQARLVDAVPEFIETIQAKFADFDYHIMVVDGDTHWGALNCTPKCPAQPEPYCIDYPCDLLDTINSCDATLGAGTVFNAGWEAVNKPCEIMDGRRYLTTGQPDLPETFACIAQVGQAGYDLVGEAMVKSISPELNGAGGCNEGFLRDDALLVVSFVTESGDYSSDGKPTEWAQAVVDAKHGDPDSVVMFGVGWPEVGGECHKLNRVCQVVRRFPYSHWISAEEPDYGPAFDAATDLVERLSGSKGESPKTLAEHPRTSAPAFLARVEPAFPSSTPTPRNAADLQRSGSRKEKSASPGCLSLPLVAPVLGHRMATRASLVRCLASDSARSMTWPAGRSHMSGRLGRRSSSSAV